MKKIILLLFAIVIVQKASAQSWPFLGSPGQGLDPQLGTNAADLLVVSETEVYSVVFQLDAFANNNVLRLYKYDGSTWTTMSSLGADASTIGRIYLRKSKLGTLFIAYSKLGAQFNYNIFVKKLVNGNFVSVGDSLGLTSGVNYFGFEIDNNDIPIVLGSKSSLLDPIRISKHENGTWVHTTVPNASGVTIEENNAFVDAQNNLIFMYGKAQMVSGVFVSSVFIDTFSNNTITSGSENINTKFTTSSYLLRDANNNMTVFNKEGGTGETYIKTYTLSNGVWNASPLDTIPLSFVNGIAMSASGKIVLANSDAKIYVGPSFNSPVSNPDANTFCLKLTCSGEKGYAIYNTGVVSGELTSSVGIESQKIVQLNAYPNPAENFIRFNTSAQIKTLKVISSDAKVVLQVSSPTEISVEGLDAGLYFLEALLEDGSIARSKILKQ